ITNSSHLICAGYAAGKPTIFKTDTLGNILWFKNIIGDTLENGYYNFILDIPEEPGHYYVGAYASESLPVARNTDILIKMDSAGDTLWTRKFTYPTFFSTLRDALVLNDKSVLTTGEVLDATGYNIIARRVDSVGNTMWENLYSIPEEQFGLNIIEMMDGSIVISGRHSNRKYSFIRIDFNGTLLDHNIVPSIRNSQYGIQKLSLLPNNNIAMSAFSVAGLDEIGHYVELDQYLDTVKNLEIGNAIFLGPVVLANYNLLFNGITFSNDLYFNIVDQSITTIHWDTLYANLNDTNLFQSNAYTFLNGAFYLGGIGGIINDYDYRIAKFSGLTDPWVPNRCSFQPPIAGFDYEYNYPVLTLRDTSSGGLKYHDTIYTWQWNTSNGFSGTDDSLQVFFDTAISKILDVELIISNWYGCTDTASVTLNFQPNGIEKIKEWEVNIFPNPAKDVLNIQMEEYLGEAIFSLYNLQGRLKMKKNLNQAKVMLSIASLPKGLYIYEVENLEQKKRGKLVKE
ncbi:MAG: T9SS type A sorting domain-containing protein, partial [Cytophagales bacterium]